MKSLLIPGQAILVTKVYIHAYSIYVLFADKVSCSMTHHYDSGDSQITTPPPPMSKSGPDVCALVHVHALLHQTGTFLYRTKLCFIPTMHNKFYSGRDHSHSRNRNCVNETLCPQPLACRFGCSHHSFHQVIYSPSSISWPNLRLLAVIVFKISLLQVFDVKICNVQ